MGKVVAVIGLAVLGILAYTWLVMLGWYAWAVPVFGLPPLTFGQGFGLGLLLSCASGIGGKSGGK